MTVQRAPSNRLRAAVAIATFGALCALLIVAWPFTYFGRRNETSSLRMRERWTHWSLHQSARIFGFNVVVSGSRPESGSIIAPNHMGYGDIFAIGGRVPCFFVSKSEVASWPIIGHMFRQSGQIAVARTRSTKSFKRTLELIANRLRANHSVCVFLEGTSSGGDSVIPFHGALLQPALSTGAPIVPAAICWRSSDNRVDIAEDVAYWKDHRFVPHLFRLVGLRGIEVEVRFGDPINVVGQTRSQAAQTLHDEVVRIHTVLKNKV